MSVRKYTMSRTQHTHTGDDRIQMLCSGGWLSTRPIGYAMVPKVSGVSAKRASSVE